MEIRDVVGSLREQILALQLEQQSLRAQVNTLERFTWNMLQSMRAAELDGLQLVWNLESNTVEALEDSTVDSTVDSPKETDDGSATLF